MRINPEYQRLIRLHHLQACRLEVYRNLNAGGYSLKLQTGTSAHQTYHLRGKVVAYADTVYLRACKLVVNQTARLAVLASGERGVHAWVLGSVILNPAPGRLHPITYNPFKYTGFTDLNTGAIVTRARLVLLTPEGMYYR